MLTQLRRVLKSHANASKAEVLRKFFRTGKGQYGHGDRFLGITVPVLRRIAAPFAGLALDGIAVLLKSPLHEERLIALIILVGQFKKGDEQQRAKIYGFYLHNTACVNNWDLVDLSAHHIVGAYLEGKSKAVLKRLAASSLLWERRIAMVATWHDIKKGRPQPALTIARILLKDEHDLMHKAVGWMLREVGKRVSMAVLGNFLRQNYQSMPRTMLRYAIEHFPEHERQAFLKGLVQ